jgi:iron complex outermembrane recepter protein
MKKMLTMFVVLLMVSATALAQRTLSGVVTEKGSGTPLVGVNVTVKGGTVGDQTDADGKFAFKGPSDAKTLVFTYVGYATQEVDIPANGVFAVMLDSKSGELGEVVISTGSRNTQRTVTDNALPIDIFSAKDLMGTGQASFDKALQYRVPSFNTVNTPVNDATTLLDPYEIRNMGPSRTLILINGKRKNLSSLLYVQFSPGRGETGVDLSAIPQEAIKRVEILRDGASAQYGSDAIAGVMNVILKDKYDYSALTVNAGLTSAGDGGQYSVALNSGANIGEKGYVNYTAGFKQLGNAIRSGIVDADADTRALTGGSAADAALVKAYLADYPTAGNLNGTGEITSANFLINAGIATSKTGEVYGNGAIVVKKVLSNANFRTPYWRQDRGLLHSVTDNGGKNYITAATLKYSGDGVDAYKGYIGYMPTFEGDLKDYNATIGFRDVTNGWKHDVSLTTGGNSQLYTLNNTINRSLGTASPTRFKPGGYDFSHLVANLDVSKSIAPDLNLAFGMEARNETYQIIAGDSASYSGQGSNSFPGLNIINASTNSRFNVGAYVDLGYDFSKDFLVNGTIRTEKYSDFGNATVFKLSSRLKISDDKVVLRGSVSTGFRAPTLHQIYAQSVQASFAMGTIVSSGLFNNQSKEARSLGIPNLKPEKSTNITLGVGLNPTKNFSVTLDYYSINVKDRVVYSSSISSSDSASTLGKILSKGGLSSVQFFINGIETNTSGLDIVASYRKIAIGKGFLNVNLAGNINLNNEIVGSPNEPKPILEAKASILNSQIKSLLTESRPKYKFIAGLDYSIGSWNFALNNTWFGTTAFRDLDNGGDAMEDLKQQFTPAVVTDLTIGYQFTDKVSLAININNILNVIPQWSLIASPSEVAIAATGGAAASALRAGVILGDTKKLEDLKRDLEFSGRYRILGYNGSQFSQLGTIFNTQLNVKF